MDPEILFKTKIPGLSDEGTLKFPEISMKDITSNSSKHGLLWGQSAFRGGLL